MKGGVPLAAFSSLHSPQKVLKTASVERRGAEGKTKNEPEAGTGRVLPAT